MTAPAEALAVALHGTITGPSTIRVGTHTIVAYPTGRVYVLPERRKLGRWSDGTDTLTAAFHDATRPVRDADMATLRAGGVR